MDIYQGGMPTLYTRSRRQRGGGFLSALKRFVIPIAKQVLPHAARAVGDIVGGKSIKETLKNRGLSAGADVLSSVAGHGTATMKRAAGDEMAPPPTKKYIKKKSVPKRRPQKNRGKRRGHGFV